MVLHGSTAIRQYRQQQERHRKQVSTARILKPLRQLAGDVARGGVDALEDCRPKLGRVWNRIPEDVRDQIVASEPALYPCREQRAAKQFRLADTTP